MDADLFACRLCSNTEELVDVGDKKTQFAAEYRNIVKIMTGIKIKPNDKLSSICRSCLKRAIENYDYRRSAIQRNAELTKKREELENRIKEDEEAVKILTGEVSSTDNKTSNPNVFDENTEDESDEVEFVSISLDITSKETATTSSACASATQTKPEQIVSPDANQNCDNNQRVEDSHTETETVNEEITASPAVDGNILLIHNTNTEHVATKTVKHVDFPPTDGNIGLCNNDNTETEFVVRKSVKRAASLAADDNIVLCKEDEAFDDDTSSSESITTEKQLHPSLKRIINQYPNIRLPASVYNTTFSEVRVELTHDAVKRQIVKLKRRFRRGYKKKVKIPTSPRDLPIQRLEIPDVMPTTSKELKELVTSSLGLQRTGPETPQKTPAISISLPTLTISHVDVTHDPESIEKTPEKSWNNRLGFTTPIDTEYSQLRLSPTEFLDTIDDENEDVDMTAASAEEECNPGDYSLIKVADEETIYICDQCHKVFQKKSNFNRHKLIHLRCVFCGVRCLSKENLQAHVRTKCPKRTRKVSVRLVPMERDAKVKHLLPSTFFKEINKEKDAEVAELPVVNDNYSAFDVALQYFRNDNNDELSDVESIHLLKEDDAESGEVRLESIEEDEEPEEVETTPVIEENSTDVDTVEAETPVIKHDVSYGVDFEETATSVIFGDAQDYEAEAAPALRVTDGSNVNQLQMDEAFHIQRLSQGCKQSDTHTTAQVQVTPKDFIAIENSGQALFIKGLANVLAADEIIPIELCYQPKKFKVRIADYLPPVPEEKFYDFSRAMPVSLQSYQHMTQKRTIYNFMSQNATNVDSSKEKEKQKTAIKPNNDVCGVNNKPILSTFSGVNLSNFTGKNEMFGCATSTPSTITGRGGRYNKKANCGDTTPTNIRIIATGNGVILKSVLQKPTDSKRTSVITNNNMNQLPQVHPVVVVIDDDAAETPKTSEMSKITPSSSSASNTTSNTVKLTMDTTVNVVKPAVRPVIKVLTPQDINNKKIVRKNYMNTKTKQSPKSPATTATSIQPTPVPYNIPVTVTPPIVTLTSTTPAANQISPLKSPTSLNFSTISQTPSDNPNNTTNKNKKKKPNPPKSTPQTKLPKKRTLESAEVKAARNQRRKLARMKQKQLKQQEAEKLREVTAQIPIAPMPVAPPLNVTLDSLTPKTYICSFSRPVPPVATANYANNRFTPEIPGLGFYVNYS